MTLLSFGPFGATMTLVLLYNTHMLCCQYNKYTTRVLIIQLRLLYFHFFAHFYIILYKKSILPSVVIDYIVFRGTIFLMVYIVGTIKSRWTTLQQNKPGENYVFSSRIIIFVLKTGKKLVLWVKLLFNTKIDTYMK